MNKNPLALHPRWLVAEEPEISKKYTKYFTRVVGPYMLLCLLDPKLIKETLQTKENNFYKDHPYLPLVRLFVGNGLIFSNGETWRKKRKIANKAFHHEKMLKMCEIMEERCNLRLDGWKEKIQESKSGEIDVLLNDETIALTLDIIGISAFGKNYSSVNINGQQVSIPEITRQLNDDVIAYGSNVSFLLCPRKAKYGLDKEARELHRKSNLMRGVGKEMIKNRIDEIKKKPQLLDDPNDLLSFMLTSHLEGRDMSECDSVIDLEGLVDECVNFIIAGSDTTSALLTWFFFNMTKHPEILARVQEEIREEFLERYQKDPHHIITYECLDKLPYLTRVLKETLRLYPSVPRLLARCAKKDVKIGDLSIKKGTLMATFPYLIHRNPANWEDPYTFNPARKEHDLNDGRFVPFSMGKRVCLGQFFAFMEAKIIISKILLQFDIACDPKGNEKLEAALTLFAKDGLRSKISLKRECL
eukprot:CAMPEP_0115007662 /NCGR_PEP_ID=MMETSP0216-20121206/21348_1 /TAXON_ID=223996 /ORGANISM="Protocruzia adherens, Strain Boccale" /LENGTH=471 /DNA_ID=CAMNT_0002374717 /DNA_START=172 /DNA_END=1587 /DNA_ORIENTATION=-